VVVAELIAAQRLLDLLGLAYVLGDDEHGAVQLELLDAALSDAIVPLLLALANDGRQLEMLTLAE